MSIGEESLYDRMLRAFNAFKNINSSTGGTRRFGEALGGVIPDFSGGLEAGLDPTRLADPGFPRPMDGVTEGGWEPSIIPNSARLSSLPSISDLQQGARAMQSGAQNLQQGGTFGSAADAVDQGLPYSMSAGPEPRTMAQSPALDPHRPLTPTPILAETSQTPGVNIAAPQVGAAKIGIPSTAGPSGFQLRPGEVPLDQIQAIVGGRTFNPYKDGKLVNNGQGGSGDPYVDEVSAYMKKLDQVQVPEPQVRMGPGGVPFIDYSATMQAKTQLQNAYQAAMETKGHYLSQQQSTASYSADRQSALSARTNELAQAKSDQELRQLLEAGRQNPALWGQVEYKQKIGVPLNTADKLMLQQRENPGVDISGGLKQIETGYAPGTSSIRQMFDTSRFGMDLTPQQKVQMGLSAIPPDQAAQWKRIAEAMGLIAPITGSL